MPSLPANLEIKILGDSENEIPISEEELEVRRVISKVSALRTLSALFVPRSRSSQMSGWPAKPRVDMYKTDIVARDHPVLAWPTRLRPEDAHERPNSGMSNGRKAEDSSDDEGTAEKQFSNNPRKQQEWQTRKTSRQNKPNAGCPPVLTSFPLLRNRVHRV